MSYDALSRESTCDSQHSSETGDEHTALVSEHGVAAAADLEDGRRGRQRLVLGLLGFMMEVVCYADRTNISLAILPMAEERGYSESTTGFILSSFFIGCTRALHFLT